MDINLVDALDELMVLRASIAHSLLDRFTDVAAVRFMTVGDDSMAIAIGELEDASMSGYRHEGIENDSRLLLLESRLRTDEIFASLSALSIKPEDFWLLASRSKHTQGIDFLGGLSCCGGAVQISRPMLIDGDVITASKASTFRISTNFEKPGLLSAVRSSDQSETSDLVISLIQRGLATNLPSQSASVVASLLSAFPQHSTGFKFKIEDTSCTLTLASKRRMVAMFVPETAQHGLPPSEDRFVVYSPANGFADGNRVVSGNIFPRPI